MKSVVLSLTLVAIAWTCPLLAAKDGKSISSHSSNHTIVITTAGKTVNLYCPSSQALRWFKDGEAFESRHNDLPFKFKRNETGTSLRLEDVKKEDSGVYVCSATNRSRKFRKMFELTVTHVLNYPPIILRRPANKTAYLGDQVTFECPIKSDLQHDLHWLKIIEVNGSYVTDTGKTRSVELEHNGQTVNITNNRETLSLSNLTRQMTGWYVCKATNFLGSEYESAWLEVVEGRPATAKLTSTPAVKGRREIYALIVVLICICLILIITLGVFLSFRVFRKTTVFKNRKAFPGGDRTVSQRIINMHDNFLYLTSKKDVTMSTFKEPFREGSDGEVYLNDRKMIFDERWEIPRNKIKISGQLGEGAFGVVMKAVIEDLENPNSDLIGMGLHGDTPFHVAVKMVKMCYDQDVQESLFQEVKVMMNIGQHVNVLQLLGCCSVEEPLMVVMEYAPHGNLRNFLRSRRPNPGSSISSSFPTPVHTIAGFSSNNCDNPHPLPYAGSDPCDRNDRKGLFNEHEVVGSSANEHAFKMIDPSFSLPSSSSSSPPSSSSPSPTSSSPPCSLHDSTPLTYRDLLSFSRQVARGAEFLTSKQCIHRDLAARNILVGENFVLKIADFGLSRDVNKRDYYRKLSDGRLPVKWMAPESLFDNIYTTKSDVWSYGILLWEIFTLGGSPYPGIPVENLLEILKKGYRMEKPAYACPAVYEVMIRCWNDDQLIRPSFTDVISALDDAISKNLGDNYLELDPEVNQSQQDSQYYANAVQSDVPLLNTTQL